MSAKSETYRIRTTEFRFSSESPSAVPCTFVSLRTSRKQHKRKALRYARHVRELRRSLNNGRKFSGHLKFVRQEHETLRPEIREEPTQEIYGRT